MSELHNKTILQNDQVAQNSLHDSPVLTIQNLATVKQHSSTNAIPTAQALQLAHEKVNKVLLNDPRGDEYALHHILGDLVPGFNGSALSGNYYGFVTGGVLPVAEAADNIVTAFDQNTAVHLPDHTVCTTVDHAALHMLLQLLNFEDKRDHSLVSLGQKTHSPLEPIWGGIFTTGATEANILGLLCGREAILKSRLQAAGDLSSATVGELGLLNACRRANVDEIQVLTTEGHSSLYKAASIAGIGRSWVKDVSVTDQPGVIDWNVLEEKLKEPRTASIVAVSTGDVNTGRFATKGFADMERLATLCRQHQAWVHVDGAFGLFARALPDNPEFEDLKSLSKGLELADSVTGDAHKLLNVPYDCGFFLTRHPSIQHSVCRNANAPYLSASAIDDGIPSPLNMGLSNSRRFRALPVYAVLLSKGAAGVTEMLANQVRLARRIAAYLGENTQYELLPDGDSRDTHVIVLFRAKDERLNERLVPLINSRRTIYVSGTVWGGKPAVRIAVSTWKVDVEHDFKLVANLLESVLKD